MLAGAAKLRVTQWARATKTDRLDGHMLTRRLASTLHSSPERTGYSRSLQLGRQYGGNRHAYVSPRRSQMLSW